MWEYFLFNLKSTVRILHYSSTDPPPPMLGTGYWAWLAVGGGRGRRGAGGPQTEPVETPPVPRMPGDRTDSDLELQVDWESGGRRRHGNSDSDSDS